MRRDTLAVSWNERLYTPNVPWVLFPTGAGIKFYDLDPECLYMDSLEKVVSCVSGGSLMNLGEVVVSW